MIDLDTLIQHMASCPEGDALAISVTDDAGVAYASLMCSVDYGVLTAEARRLPDHAEGREIGLQDMPACFLLGDADGQHVAAQARKLAGLLMEWGIAKPVDTSPAAPALPNARKTVEWTVGTKHGLAKANVGFDAGVVQLNVFAPPTPDQPPFFLVYPRDKQYEAVATVRALIEGLPMDENTAISTDVAKGALAAGTGRRVKVASVTFGTPEVHRADEVQEG